VKLYPGMAVDVSIVTGERTLLEYYFSPCSTALLMRSASNSLQDGRRVRNICSTSLARHRAFLRLGEQGSLGNDQALVADVPALKGASRIVRRPVEFAYASLKSRCSVVIDHSVHIHLTQ